MENPKTSKEIARDFVSEVWSSLGTANQNKMITFDMSQLEQYQVIVALPTIGSYDKAEFLGYPVQIRKKVGAFGSDVVLLRDIDGNLSTWENQGFLLPTKAQSNFITPFFEKLIEDEKSDSNIYTIKGENAEEGYIIHNAAYSRSQGHSIRITKKDGNGMICEDTVIVG